jgi:hypothetical protein
MFYANASDNESTDELFSRALLEIDLRITECFGRDENENF